MRRYAKKDFVQVRIDQVDMSWSGLPSLSTDGIWLHEAARRFPKALEADRPYSDLHVYMTMRLRRL